MDVNETAWGESSDKVQRNAEQGRPMHPLLETIFTGYLKQII